jgi:hypothetical protein
LLRQVAADNDVGELVEAYAADPRDLLEALLPQSQKADIVVVDPPGTPLHGLSPFALLPPLRKRLLKEDAIVVPAGGCLEVVLLESVDLAQMFSVPGGQWKDVDLTVWNEESRRQRILSRLVPYTKWFGPHSRMAQKWLSTPQCAFTVNLRDYGRDEPHAEENISLEIPITATGLAHAVVARWTVWDSPERTVRLGAEPAQDGGGELGYLGRSLTWTQYVQALAAPGTGPGLLEPVAVREGEVRRLRLTVRQGKEKRTGAAGPEFTLRLDGAHDPDADEADAGARLDSTEL